MNTESRGMNTESSLHGLQHTRLPCPSLSPRVCSDSYPLSWWYYLTIWSSAALFSFCLLSFRVFGSFPMSWFFTSGSQNIGSSTSVLPMNIQGRFPLWLTSLISLLSRGLSSLLQYHSLKSSVLQCLAFFIVHLSHPYMTTGKTIALTRWTFVGKVMSLIFNMLFMLVIGFLPRSRHHLILILILIKGSHSLFQELLVSLLK